MSTPSNPPDHAAAEVGPPSTDPGGEPAEAVTPPAPPPPVAPPPALPAQPPAGPFTPVVREPRIPWVNPARRGHIAAAAIVGALAFGGAGALVGYAVTEHRDHRDTMRFERGPGPGTGGHGFGRDQRLRNHGGPRPNVPGAPNGPNVPIPTASSAPTR